MRKFKTFLLAIVAALLCVPSAFAQEMIGRVVLPEELADGMEVVFEARSGTTSKGRYLVPFKHASGTQSCLQNTDILSVPEQIVWVLEKADTVNAVTGMEQWYIKNRSTGKYLTFEWNWSADDKSDMRINKWDAGIPPFVSTKDSAKAFCLVSNGDTQWAGQYGSNSYGSSQSDWTSSTYTVTYIFDATGYTNTQSDGGGYGRVFLANEFEVSGFNITWFSQYQDTNVWDIRRVIDRGADARTALEDFLDTFPANIEETYKVGNDPGFISQEIYDQFYGIYSEAAMAVTDESVSNDKLTELFNSLYDAKNVVESSSSVVQVKNGGYYYIKVAYSAFTDVDNGDYGWIAPYTTQYAGWQKIKSDDNRFIWQITENPDPDDDARMYYTFQNMGSGKYLGKAAAHDNSQPVLFTDQPEERMFIGSLGSGQFNIGSKYDYYDEYPPRPYHQEGHGGGAGTKGMLVLWDGGLNSGSAWYISVVPQEAIDNMSKYVQKDSLRATFMQYENTASSATVSDQLGYASSQEIIDNLKTAVSNADSLLNLEETPSDDVLIAARTAIETAAKAYQDDVNKVPDGAYRLHSAYIRYEQAQSPIYMGLYNDTVPGWKTEASMKNAEFVWYINKQADGTYTVRNAQNNKYINKAKSSTNGSIVSLSAEPVTNQVIASINGNGRFAIIDTEDYSVKSTFSYDPNGHGDGLYPYGSMQLWSPAENTGGTAWILEPVGAEELATIEANKEQEALNAKAKTLFEEARRAYNAKATYALGDSIITSVDQIYANNWSTNEGMHLEYLIDNNLDTYWNSTWEDGTEQDAANPHYLRFYDESGFPDSIQVKYAMRQNDSWHRVFARMRVEVSNDTENWTALPNEFKCADFGGYSLLSTLQKGYLNFVVNGIGGYKYVRFVGLAVINAGTANYSNDNYHAVIEFSEMNLYPITGEAENSFTQQAAYKPVASELLSQVQNMNKKLAAGTVTQAEYDALKAALESFNGLEATDSLIIASRLNRQNLTAGEAIGEFPEDDLNAYNDKVDALLNTYDAKVEDGTITYDELTATVNGLKEAYAALYPTMNVPEQNAWYTITTANEAYNGYALKAGGNHTHAYGLNYTYILDYVYEDGGCETKFHWTINQDENGRYVPQNVWTAGYFGPYTGSGNSTYNYRPIMWYEPMAFTIVPFGEGQVGLLTAEGYFVQNNPSWLNYGLAYKKYEVNADVETYKNSDYAFTIERSDAEHSPLTDSYYTCCNGRVLGLTMPYEYELPAQYVGDETEDLIPYEIVGKVSDEENSMVTAYQLRQIESETVAAGKPVIYIMPGEYNEEKTGTVTLTPVMNTALKAERDTVNGLVSVPADWKTDEAHYGYFLADSVVDEPIETQIGNKRTVIIPRFVSQIADASVDAVIYVQGAGMLNGIKQSNIVAVKLFVDVYTTDGVLVRKHVDADKATEGLGKGVYLVGNKKVLVK